MTKMVSQTVKVGLKKYWTNKSMSDAKLKKKLYRQSLEIEELKERLEALEAKPKRKRSKKLPKLEEDVILAL